MSTNEITIYGIKACDTMKKAMTWLETSGVAFTFHDYKKQAIDEPKLREWLTKVEWSELINRRGTTWRNLSDVQKTGVDNDAAVKLMLQNQSLIKRPLLEKGGEVYLGFKPDNYEAIFSK
ncbi:arsenate reductase [Oleiphilus sp. HI0071]|uniref:ArsC family reductase n=1 Tax=unclassified Oleiphilus TaxID=2631174 RepID=UPI0007C23744|nr:MULTISPECIES: ArsC family reductase [unclassified Oleiphilus]KZY70926.1 arsenate reductase [Oleiphilus sp. HI0065]KZY82429.1 arsenate reductase [Oleiphilus sp. HI0071]KZY91510.1 arsenate reductase [Oleiphilus sp. HI0073]KZZ40209.1 arsenate reductase [Oleiphilus sp. HI0118]KZZ52256.1 arsenate reductase [Oleiphilus sp. HI0122]KZZ64112.1 arsenate reductase [Oleiphilus sp. HI0130]KZZ76691.1 arsenate reductase [Oleiphilus sp. HI0133]